MKIDREKSIFILSGVLILQILLLIGYNFFSFESRSSSKSSKPAFKNLTEKNIKKIEIVDFIDTFTLEKSDSDVWTVHFQEYVLPIDQQKIDSYLSILSELSEGTVVYNAQDEAGDGQFGFDEMNGQTVNITNEKGKTYTVMVGNPGNSKGTSYVIYNNDKKVRIIDSNISRSTDNQHIHWAKKDIFSFLELGNISRVTVTGESELQSSNYAIEPDTEEKKETKYLVKPENDKEANQVVLRNMLRNILQFNVNEYKLTGNVKGKELHAELLIDLFDGQQVKAHFYHPVDEDDIGDYIIDTDFDDYLYLVHEENAKKILKEYDELFESDEDSANNTQTQDINSAF